MEPFEGKVAAITGAGSGIGRGLALELAAEGSHLALSDVEVSSAGVEVIGRDAVDAGRPQPSTSSVRST